MDCGYECHRIGGPWIAENPSCPIHNADAQRQSDRELDEYNKVLDSIYASKTVEELREVLIVLAGKIYNQ